MNYYNYFTEVEEHFVRRRGKHLQVSPLDWSLIETWRDQGVPLHVALRGIDQAMDSWHSRPRRYDKLNTLFYCHDAVMREFERYTEAHTGESAPVQGDGEASESAKRKYVGPDREAILGFIQARISEIKTLAAKLPGREGEDLKPVLERALARLEEIARDLATEARIDDAALERDLGILDQTLTAGLATAVPAEEQSTWQEEAKKELKIYRKRLPKETYRKILDNFMTRKVHQRFELGELSLFHL